MGAFDWYLKQQPSINLRKVKFKHYEQSWSTMKTLVLPPITQLLISVNLKLHKQSPKANYQSIFV